MITITNNSIIAVVRMITITINSGGKDDYNYQV